MGHVHRKNCVHQLEEAKLQKEIDEELMLSRSFKGNDCQKIKLISTCSSFS